MDSTQPPKEPETIYNNPPAYKHGSINAYEWLCKDCGELRNLVTESFIYGGWYFERVIAPDGRLVEVHYHCGKYVERDNHAT